MIKEIGVFIAGAALVLEGCSSVSTPSPKSPHENSGNPQPNPSFVYNELVNCKLNPNDSGAGQVFLYEGDAAVVGGINKYGEEEYIIVINQDGILVSGGASADFKATPISKTTLDFYDSKSKFDILVEATPNQPSPIRATIKANCQLNPNSPQS